MNNLVGKIEAFIGNRYQTREYPVLQSQFVEWSVSRPLAGLKVLDATPLFANTLLKHRALIAAGAELTIGLSDFIPYDRLVLDFVKRELQLSVVDDVRGSYDVVADCAAAYSGASSRLGYVELTRSGVDAYAAKGVRTYVVDSSIIKRFETQLGTGDSYFRAMEQLGYSDWKGKKIAVFGSGKVGCGIAAQAIERGAQVVVVSDPASSQTPVVDYKDKRAAMEVVLKSDFVVMATGVKGAFEKTIDIDNVINGDAIWANMGAEDEFGASVPEKRVLCGKRTLNFILDEPTSMCYIEATMALHNYGAAFLATDTTSQGLIFPSANLENSMLDISAKDGVIAAQISTITHHRRGDV